MYINIHRTNGKAIIGKAIKSTIACTVCLLQLGIDICTNNKYFNTIYSANSPQKAQNMKYIVIIIIIVIIIYKYIVTIIYMYMYVCICLYIVI